MKMKRFTRGLLFITLTGMSIMACNEDKPEPELTPRAKFTFEKLSVNCSENCQVQFSNASLNADSYIWDFGDSSPASTEAHPLHTYPGPGSYQVKLEALSNEIADDTVVTIDLNAQVFVVNAGNFGQGNGTIALYNEEMQSIVNAAITNANNGSAIGAGIQSFYIDEKSGYIICNGSDKIEIVDANSLEYLANPITNLTTPRYMYARNGLGYITCWGPWSDNWTLDESYIAGVDLTSRTITDSLDCGSGPEGIVSVSDKVFIANSYDNSITVYDAAIQNSSTIDVSASPQHFEVGADGMLWVALGSLFGKYGQDQVGLQAINTSDLSLGTFVNIPGMSDYGEMTIDGDGRHIYFFIAEAWPGTGTDVYSMNTETKTVSSSALITGNNFFGIGYNNMTDKLYISDAAAYQGPGKILVYDKAGTKVDEQITGIGPYHFVFE